MAASSLVVSPDDRQMAATTCKTRPLSDCDGIPFASVSGATLRTFLEHPVKGAEELRRLLTTHGLVVFREANLTPEEEVKLNKLPGWHTDRSTPDSYNFGWSTDDVGGIGVLPNLPEVLCQGSAILKDHHGIPALELRQRLSFEREGYHVDGAHNLQDGAPVLTSMYCLRAPLAGGETHFVCGRSALSRAPSDLQDLARRITVHYHYDEAAGLPIMRDGIVREGRGAPLAAAETKAPPAVQTSYPLVRRHCESGEEALYISCANIERMEAAATVSQPALLLDVEESYRLVEALLGEATSARGGAYMHKWREGDFAIWDNRLLLHAPCSELGVIGERLHHRVRLSGSDVSNADVCEHRARVDLAAAHTLSHHYGFDELVWNHISSRLTPEGTFLVTPGDGHFDEVTPPSLVRSSPGNLNVTADVIHAAIYGARPDVKAIVHHHTPAVAAVSCFKSGLQYLTQDASAFVDRVAYHDWEGVSDDYDEKDRIAAALGPSCHTLLMRHHGAVTVGSTVAEAWVRYYYLDRLCSVQCAAGGAACRQPRAAVLEHAATQLGPGGPFCHGRYEWAALLRLAARLQSEAAVRRNQVQTVLPAPARQLCATPAATERVPPERLSFEEHLRSLENAGYCIVSDIIPPSEVTTVRESVAGTTAMHFNPNAPKTIGHVPGLIRYNQSFAPYLSEPKLLRIVEAVFGVDSKITFTTGQTNHPGCERQEWHSDWYARRDRIQYV